MGADKLKPIRFYDGWLVLAAVGLIIFGVVMVASASMVISDRQYGQPFHYLFRQSAHLLLGIGLACFIFRVEIDKWQRASGTLLLIALAALLLVLIPGIGHHVNGSTRWIGVGPIGMQVSELAKLFVIIYLASYLERFQDAIKTHAMGFIKPMIVLSVVAVLLLAEPDFGAAVVIMATALGMMFLAGVRFRYFVLLLLVVGGAMGVLAFSSSYRVERLTTFLHPWANQFGSGYQLTQSLIAFGRGSWFGVGLGDSIQKLFYLPEAHTDFLFAVLAEELGLVGMLAVLGLFALLVSRVLLIGRRAQHQGSLFAAFMAYGFALWIGLQAMINIGVNAGMLPTKGLTLPLMSYGGSSVLIMCAVLGIILRIDYEARVEQFAMSSKYML
ncbi:MAG: putative lipid II flippase FtsW [Legionellales bacterium]|nr:putative lipid II flippase FtsW [Legionellales bacterium]|tara:strand:+ start:30385 stop:31539 length:1155 start_codon:yes stop_codon:yes gene_type:complete